MNDILQVNYEQMTDIAAIFNRMHTDIETLTRSIKIPFEQLKGGDWIGAGSVEFVKTMEQQLLPAFDRWRDAISNAFLVTQNVTNLMREAEEEAARQFQQSDSNSPDRRMPQTTKPTEEPTLQPQMDDPIPIKVRKAWQELEKLSDADEKIAKQSIYQSVVDSVLSSFGVESVTVVIEDLNDPANQDVRGKFDPIRNVLIIDIDNIDDPTTLITAIHEARHAIQYEAAARLNDGVTTWPWNGITQGEARQWKFRFDTIEADQESGVPIGRGNKPNYDTDPLEIDAREYADEYASTMKPDEWILHILEGMQVLHD